MNLIQLHEEATEPDVSSDTGRTGISKTPTIQSKFINIKVPIPKGVEMKQRELADFVMTQMPGVTASGRSFEVGLKFYDNKGHMCKLIQQAFSTVLTGTEENKVFMQQIMACIGKYYNQLKASGQQAQTQIAMKAQ